MSEFWNMSHEERVALIKSDPEKFNTFVDQEKQKLYTQSPKLEQLQWVTDAKMRKIKNPVERMNQAGALMVESLKKLNESLKPFRKKT